MKYFTWNFDDGLEEDKEIVRILKQNNMGATFNLNSSLFGKRKMIGRIGNLGIKEVPLEEYDENRFSLLKYSIHYRIPEDEIVDVYSGFEVASHTAEHVNLTKCSKEECIRQVQKDQRKLSEMFQTEITGFAYPYGRSNASTKEALTECGITYARVINSTDSFCLVSDTMELPMTGWHLQKNIFEKIQRFIDSESEEDEFFLIFAHGYEFDFNTKESNFEKFKRICDMVAGRDDICCCSTGEAITAIKNTRK